MVKQVQVNGEVVIPLLHGAALVASHSEPGAWHAVKGRQCDCKGYAHYHRCRHVRAVDALALAEDQNELLHVEPQRERLWLNERPHQPIANPRSFEEVFGITPPAA